ncbi:MAG: hypothetical protein ABIQ88_15185 [Chitinophagaceae bacterium]
MKYQSIIITVCIALISYGAAAQKKQVKKTSIPAITAHPQEDAFAVAVLKALQQNDTAAWISLYPTNDEYKGILQAGLAAKAEGLTQQVIDDILVRRKKEAAAVYASQFSQYLAQADSLHIYWENVVFEKFEFQEVYPEPVKLKYLGGNIRFSCKQQHFLMEGIQAVSIASGYKLQSLAGLRVAEDGE